MTAADIATELATKWRERAGKCRDEAEEHLTSGKPGGAVTAIGLNARADQLDECARQLWAELGNTAPQPTQPPRRWQPRMGQQ